LAALIGSACQIMRKKKERQIASNLTQINMNRVKPDQDDNITQRREITRSANRKITSSRIWEEEKENTPRDYSPDEISPSDITKIDKIFCQE